MNIAIRPALIAAKRLLRALTVACVPSPSPLPEHP